MYWRPGFTAGFFFKVFSVFFLFQIKKHWENYPYPPKWEKGGKGRFFLKISLFFFLNGYRLWFKKTLGFFMG